MKILKAQITIRWWQFALLIALSGYSVGSIAAKTQNALGL